MPPRASQPVSRLVADLPDSSLARNVALCARTKRHKRTNNLLYSSSVALFFMCLCSDTCSLDNHKLFVTCDCELNSVQPLKHCLTMGGASSSRLNQWEKEVVRGRGLGEGAGNIVRQNTDEEEERKQEEQERKKVKEIVRRHSMLKAQLIENAMRKQQAAEEEAAAAVQAGPEVDEENMGAKKASFGASQHRQLLASLKKDGESSAAGTGAGGENTAVHEEVRDFGELRARITLQSSGDTCFSTDDLEVEAHTLETCFSSVALGMGLLEGQFECRVVDATAVHAPAGAMSPAAGASQAEPENSSAASSSSSSSSSPSNQANCLVFRMVIRFFTTAEGFSAQLLDKMHTFLGFTREQNGDWTASPSAQDDSSPICDEFRLACEKGTQPCSVRVGKVTQAVLKLATGAEARVPMSP